MHKNNTDRRSGHKCIDRKHSTNRKKCVSIMATLLAIMVAFSFSFTFSIGTAMPSYAATKVDTVDQRIAGDNRYDTSLKVMEALYQKSGAFNNVVVACGRNFPDALSGGYLAKAKKAPIVLETPGYDEAIISAIQKYMNPAGTVYILGGTEAVQAAFEEAVKAKSLKTERLSGQTRYDTNLEVLKEANSGTGELAVASGKNYADALSGSALGMPMLLVGEGLTPAQLEWIKNSGIKKIHILGGNSAVNTAVENSLKSIATVERVSGANRYDTSRKIASKFFSGADAVTLVSGKNFPDGLSGAPIAMEYSSPILLTASDSLSYARSFVVDKGITKDITIGGNSAVSAATVQKIMEQYVGEKNHVHVWTTSFKWDDLDATATFRCMDCGETETKDATVSYKITKAATHTETGTITFTAKVAGPDGISHTANKNKTLPKIFHEYTWAWDEAKYNSGSRSFTVKAYSYVAGGYGASGKPAVVGTIAVDRSVIPLGTRVYVEGYGFAVANDTGGNIIGRTVDLVMNSEYMCRQWGVRYPTIYILG